VAALVAALAEFPMSRQEAVHRSCRADVDAPVHEDGFDLGRSLVDELRVVEDGQDAVPLDRVEGAGRRRLDGAPRRATRLAAAVEGGAADPEGGRGGDDADVAGEGLGSLHEPLPSLLGGFRGIPKSSEVFF